MTTGCNASLGLAGAVHDCDWTEPHPGHAHHNHQAGATWTGATWRDLATLRAEVEALRDDALKRREQAAEAVAAYWNRPGDYWAADQVRRYQYEGTTYNAQKDAYQTVLDLIDKQREGQ